MVKFKLSLFVIKNFVKLKISRVFLISKTPFHSVPPYISPSFWLPHLYILSDKYERIDVVLRNIWPRIVAFDREQEPAVVYILTCKLTYKHYAQFTSELICFIIHASALERDSYVIWCTKHGIEILSMNRLK